MSQGFNPYREWLGIAPHGETPTYYELLGLRPLEADATKVEPAYQRQAAKIAPQLSSGQADVAQRLMSELAEARITLMTPTAKRAYDSALTAAVQAAGQKAAAPSTPVRTDTAPTPPAAQPLSPQPLAAQPMPVQPAPSPVYGQAQAAAQAAYAYPAQVPGYPAPMHGAPQGYSAAPVYPGAHGYPGWQGQPGSYSDPASANAAGYYAAPAAAYPPAPEQAVGEAASIPAIRRRPPRRRSSAVPALVGVVVAAAAIGGLWLYLQRDESVAVGKPDQNSTGSPDGGQTSPAPTSPSQASNAPQRRSATNKPERAGQNEADASRSGRTEGPSEKPKIEPPVVIPAPAVIANKPATASSMPDDEMPAGDGDKPEMEKPADGKPNTDLDKPSTDKPEPDMPAPDKPNDDSMPDSDKPKEEPISEPMASAEEAATVGKLLKSARAALADRDIAKAQDLLAEATIEATAPDTTAEVSQVETLTGYVEMFWDAVRKTLPKIELEELEINGTMLAVVEADENHLIVRAEGKNHEYRWQKLPHSLAYYLANRWLAPDDPVRNLVLGAFEIVDPTGDREHAETLLDAASAAKLKTDPLAEELKLARGK
jgi:hypothetical protein